MCPNTASRYVVLFFQHYTHYPFAQSTAFPSVHILFCRFIHQTECVIPILVPFRDVLAFLSGTSAPSHRLPSFFYLIFFIFHLCKKITRHDCEHHLSLGGIHWCQ